MSEGKIKKKEREKVRKKERKKAEQREKEKKKRWKREYEWEKSQDKLKRGWFKKSEGDGLGDHKTS